MRISEILAFSFIAWLGTGWLVAIIAGTGGAPLVGMWIGVAWLLSFLLLLVIIPD